MQLQSRSYLWSTQIKVLNAPSSCLKQITKDRLIVLQLLFQLITFDMFCFGVGGKLKARDL